MTVPQIFDRNMKRLAYLDNAISVGYTLEANSLWTATFTMPADDKKNQYCEPLNYVEIFDGDERIDLFRIIGEDLERGDGATRFYNCEHVLATLLNDVLFQYHQCGGTGIRTAAVLNYILARQTVKNWVLGSCGFARQFEYNWENSTLLSALFAVPECFDSDYLWEWDTTGYPWTLSLIAPSEKLKSEIRYAKNMTNIKKTLDATGLANRIYALGYGEGVNQLTIAGVNGGLPYVEDALSIEKYGLCSTILVDTRYEVAENLKAYAKQILRESAEPYVSYEIGAIDLHRLTKDAFSRFRPGEIVRVIDDEDKINLRTRIVSVTKDDAQGDPGTVTVTLANKSQDIAGSISDLQSRALIGETYAQGSTNQQIYNFADNADTSHPATLKLYISESVVRINKMLLNIQFEPFRAFEKAIGGGGGQTTSGGGGQTTSSGGGSTTSSGGGSTTSAGGGQTTSSGGGSTTSAGGGVQMTSSSVSLASSNTVHDSYDDGGPGGANHNHALVRGDKIALTDGTKITGYRTFAPSGKHAGYPFAVVISCAGVTAEHVPEVTFGVAEATGGNFAPVALSGAGTVTIYAAEKPGGTITLLGFNHNASYEGSNRIHFQLAKTAVSGGTDVALCDSSYNSTGSSAAFRMNTTNTNAGGWNGSYMKKTICPAFENVVPSDLRANLKTVTKYTDNTGSASTAQANVTATTEKFFPLAEYEVFGTITYANIYEANKQAQYDYYKAGNSKVKYRHDATTTAVFWWLRSPRRSSSTYFVRVNTGGTVNFAYANISLAFAPGFCV